MNTALRSVATARLARWNPSQPSPLDSPLGGTRSQRAIPLLDVDQVETGASLSGPFDLPPAVSSGMEAAQLLAHAIAGLPLGQADRALLARTERWHWSDVAVLASLFERARAAGAAGGAR